MAKGRFLWWFSGNEVKEADVRGGLQILWVAAFSDSILKLLLFQIPFSQALGVHS